MKICLIYHCLFFKNDPPEPLPASVGIVEAQMKMVSESGLFDAASEMLVGVNGGLESEPYARMLLPAQVQTVFHGLDFHNENGTILEMEKWLPGHDDWYVLYFHSKGATHADHDRLRDNWRACMMRNLVTEWRRCVSDLDSGCDAVGCHWMTGDKTPPGQSIFAGNFWWAKASFLLTLPSIMKRDRIAVSGLGHVDSRYESEVWIGNGPRLPKVKDYHPAWINTCKPD